MAIFIFFTTHWYLSLFVQTFFLHRYAAHKMFTMGPRAEKFFYWLTYVFQGSSFLSPYAYGVMHRLHHAHADTEEDPHSPSFSKNLFDMMWKTKNFYQSIVNKADSIDFKFKKNVPHWDFMEKMADTWMSRVGWGLAYTSFYFVFAHSYWVFILLPFHFVMGPIHGVIINWFAHKYGYRNYDVDDTARNLLPIDILMMGESYHNNHHKFGGRANFGIKWHEFDPTYPIILLLDKLNVIQLKKNNDMNYM